MRNVDIEYNGTRLGSIMGEFIRGTNKLKIENKIYPLEILGDWAYVSMPPEEALELGFKVDRVNKDIYIMMIFKDLLGKYRSRFQRAAPMDLHEQLRHRAVAIVEDLW